MDLYILKKRFVVLSKTTKRLSLNVGTFYFEY